MEEYKTPLESPGTTHLSETQMVPVYPVRGRRKRRRGVHRRKKEKRDLCGAKKLLFQSVGASFPMNTIPKKY